MRVRALLLCLMILPTMAACRGPKEEAHLVIGFKTNLIGVSHLINGAFVGSDPTVAASLARRLSITYTGAPITQQGWQDALNLPDASNHVDMVISAISYVDNRKVKMAYSYMKTDLGVLTPTDAVKISQESDLVGKTVCVNAKSTAESEMISYLKIRPISEDQPRCLARLRDGTAQVYVSDRLILMGVAANKSAGGFTLADAHFGKYQYYVVALPAEGDAGLCLKVVEALREYVGSTDWVNDLKTSLTLNFSADEIQEQFSTKTEITDQYCSSS